MSDNDGSDDTPDNTEDNTDNKLIIAPVIATRAPNKPSRSLKLYNQGCVSWLNVAITAFTFKTLCLTGVDPTVSQREIGFATQKSKGTGWLA